MTPTRGRAPARSVDWDRIKARLKAADEALAAGEAGVSPERRRAILHQRALVHAALPIAPEPVGARIDIVEFMLGTQRHAVAAESVREVLPLTRLTALPCTPDFVAGVIHLHGRIVSVIDLKRLFGLPHTDLTDLNRLVVVQHGGFEMALLADRIVGVGTLRLADLQPPADEPRAACLRGIAPGALALFDVERLLNDPKMVVDESVGP